MATAAELAARTECVDLERRLTLTLERITARDATIFRLNGLIVARDAEIDRLRTKLALCEAELADLRAGVTDASLLGY